METMIKILFICHGNICRSPMAHLYFQDLVQRQGLGAWFTVESAATSSEETGNPVHPGTRRKLEAVGISCQGKTARQMVKKDYDTFDYLIGMDRWNIKNMLRITGGDPDKKIYKMMEFVGGDGISENSGEARDVADPWYTGDFEATWRDVTEGCQGLLAFLEKKHHLPH
jgi:protein-tyrosine phosphatase